MQTYSSAAAYTTPLLAFVLLGCGHGPSTTDPANADRSPSTYAAKNREDGHKGTQMIQRGIDASREDTEGYQGGSEDTLGTGEKKYRISCENVGEKPKRPAVLGREVLMTVKTGRPFLLMNGKYRGLVNGALKVERQPVGWGFRGIIAEDADGEPLLDITFIDADTIKDVQDGTEIKSQSSRWLKTDFCRKPLEFMMRDAKGELLWGIKITIKEYKPGD